MRSLGLLALAAVAAGPAMPPIPDSRRPRFDPPADAGPRPESYIPLDPSTAEDRQRAYERLARAEKKRARRAARNLALRGDR